MKTNRPADLLIRWIQILCLFFLAFFPLVNDARADEAKKIVLVAGPPADSTDDHEFRAGVLLLKRCLDGVPGVTAIAYTNGWPEADNAFEGADAIVLYFTGGPNHAALQGNHLLQLRMAMKGGTGLACLHSALDLPADKGGPEFREWMGGCYEANTSVKAFWDADFITLQANPILRGVMPFSLRDEWYYHIHFQDHGIMPVLMAAPPNNPNGAKPEIVAWAYQRPDGGRGFGFTGGHYHKNWGDENFRKVVLNGILWIAKVEIPPDGVDCKVTAADLSQNLDPRPPKK